MKEFKNRANKVSEAKRNKTVPYSFEHETVLTIEEEHRKNLCSLFHQNLA